MRLAQLARRLAKFCGPVSGRAEADPAGPELARACFDSRRVRPGDLFCALPGCREDGARFAAAAAAQGAAAVLHGGLTEGLGVPELVVRSPGELRRAAALAAAHLAGRPSEELFVAAVTGTNGKTTVVHLLEQALTAAGVATGAAGTLGLRFGGRSEAVENTTPGADVLQDWLRRIVDAGARAVALEASSHGLHQHRLDGVSVDAAAWTNLTHDHLDYHPTLEDYRAAKARLIHGLSADASALLPAAEPRTLAACHGARAQLWTWSLEGAAALAGRFHPVDDGFVLTVRGVFGDTEIRSPLIGRHNAENLLVAYGLARLAGLRVEEAGEALSSAQAAPGRLERIAPDAPWALFVDYAHTPDALFRALAALRQAFPERRLHVVCGAGGDRDPVKRAPMGEAAARGADVCWVTSDNPRSEDPDAIVGQVAAGAERGSAECHREPDRRRALEQAVAGLAPGDVLLVAGKGHEDYQEVAGVRHPFDDAAELREVVQCST